MQRLGNLENESDQGKIGKKKKGVLKEVGNVCYCCKGTYSLWCVKVYMYFYSYSYKRQPLLLTCGYDIVL